MFRLQNNVPEVYVQQSRDFQLFCRLYDSVFGSVKFSIDSLARSSATGECNVLLLELLKTKLGLFTNIDISETELRYVLQAFPTLIRHKGSWKGIYSVLYLFQRIGQNMSLDPPTANEETINNRDDRKLKISFSNELVNDKLLLHLITYVLPAGYNVQYITTKKYKPMASLALEDDIKIDAYSQEAAKTYLSKIRHENANETITSPSPEDYDAANSIQDEDLYNTHSNTVGMTQIIISPESET